MSLSQITLPDRPLTVSPDALRTPQGAWWSIPLLLALAVGLGIWQGPGLWRDWQIAQSPMTLPAADVRDGECSTYQGFFTRCSAHLSYDFKEQSWESDVSLIFADLHRGDYQVMVVVSSANPALATLSLGVEKLWNRVIMFALLMLLLAGGALAMIRAMLRARRSIAALREPARLAVAPAYVTQLRRGRGAAWVSYADARGGRGRKIGQTRFAGPDGPVMMPDAQGHEAALAVRHPGSDTLILLDRGLTRLDLTHGERAAMLERIDAEAPAAVRAGRRRGAGRRVLRAILGGIAVLALIAAGLVGYWAWYATSGKTAFDAFGMTINQMMPAAANQWACDRLAARFGDQHPPSGCVGVDFTTWKQVRP